MHIYSTPATANVIPVIDLSESFSSKLEARRRVASEIHKACRETGFFYIGGHGVPEELIASQFEYTKMFFNLPIEEKLAIHMKNSPSKSGYEPVGAQILDSQDSSSSKAPPDLKESFYCGRELSPDDLSAQKKNLSYAQNQWPQGLPEFRHQMLSYQAAMRKIGDHVLTLIALSLDLSEDYFAAFYDTPSITLRLLCYPPHPSSAQENQLGAGAHTDWGGITLLLQDQLGGLEVRNVENEWVAAPPIPGTFVVNLGDLMQRWTNNVYRSNFHRVKNNSSNQNRYSVPFFYNPRMDSLIECLPTCNDAEHPPQFAACTASEHIHEMFMRSYGYKPSAQ